jgi:hypothetical protein
MFDSLTGSLIIVLVIGAILVGFAMFVTALMTWIVGSDPDVPYRRPLSPTEQRPQLRKAA